MSTAVAFIAALLCGILTGVGVGGGTLLMALLVCAADFSSLQAGLTNLIYFICTAPFALYSHFKNGILAKKAGLTAGAAGCAGVLLSSLLPRTDLKTVMAVLFITVGIKELLPSKKERGDGNNIRGE